VSIMLDNEGKSEHICLCGTEMVEFEVTKDGAKIKSLKCKTCGFEKILSIE